MMKKKTAQKKKSIPPSQESISTKLPTPETLALIAANVSGEADFRPESAVDYAFELWEKSRSKLISVNKEYEQIAQFQIVEDTIPCPEKFPATFKEFLKLIVLPKTYSDKTKRLRDFCHCYHEYRFDPPTKPERTKESDKEWNEIITDWKKDQDFHKNEFSSKSKKEIEEMKDNQASKMVSKYKEKGFHSKGEWVWLAEKYLKWEESQASTRNRKNASK